MRKFLLLVLLVGFFALSLETRSVFASEIDLLLQKLVDKGVLTAGEAQQIGTETKEQIKKEIAEGKDSSLPAWVQNTKLKGDFRLRYQWDKDKGMVDQSRVRIRARVGVESKVNDKLTVAVGIATGKESDPRTRNVTLGNNDVSTNTPGSPKAVVLDYAYAQYMPVNGVTLVGGKIQNPLWRVHNLFWDDNITPEGVGLQLSHKVNSKLELFMNDLVYIMKNDSRTDAEPTLFANQLGAKLQFNDNTALKTALTSNVFTHIEGAQKFASENSTTSGSGNVLATNSFTSTGSGGMYLYSYNTIQPAAELSFKEPFHGFLPFASLFGEYMYNTALPSGTTGRGAFDVGVKFGDEAVADAKQWQARLIYSKLGRDAWLDILTDTDRYYAGRTNSKAYEAIFDYGLGKNTWLRLNYYWAECLDKASTGGYIPEQTLQVDWNMKF